MLDIKQSHADGSNAVPPHPRCNTNTCATLHSPSLLFAFRTSLRVLRLLDSQRERPPAPDLLSSAVDTALASQVSPTLFCARFACLLSYPRFPLPPFTLFPPTARDQLRTRARLFVFFFAASPTLCRPCPRSKHFCVCVPALFVCVCQCVLTCLAPAFFFSYCPVCVFVLLRVHLGGFCCFAGVLLCACTSRCACAIVHFFDARLSRVR